MNSITGISGRGTNLFIHTADSKSAHKLCVHLVNNGILTKLNEGKGISIKPALIFGEKHADMFVDALSRFREWRLVNESDI